MTYNVFSGTLNPTHFTSVKISKYCRNRAKRWQFGGKWGVNVKFWFCIPQKGTCLRGTASFDVFCVSVRGGVLAVRERKNPHKISRVNSLVHKAKTPHFARW